jgi:hypothetical protein
MIWHGAVSLQNDLVEISRLVDAKTPAAGDSEKIKEALDRDGQVRPILVATNKTDVVERQHLLNAARELGWTHVAVRLKAAEETSDDTDQLSFLDATTDQKTIAALAKQPEWEERETAVEEVNDASKNPDHEWVGLPEFVPASEAFKIVISCETIEDREALFDVLGIRTIHKGTRGTLSVWWPDRERKDLASIRFVDEDSL